jgi:hypothetical protein
MGPGWWIADLNRILSAGLPSLNLILDEAEGLPVKVQLVSDCTPFEQADTLVCTPTLLEWETSQEGANKISRTSCRAIEGKDTEMTMVYPFTKIFHDKRILIQRGHLHSSILAIPLS